MRQLTLYLATLGVSTAGLLFWSADAEAACSPSYLTGISEPDGVKDLLEACDDGNDVNGDGCSDTCEIETAWECALPFNAERFTAANFGTGANRWVLNSSGLSGTQLANTDQPSVMLFGANAKALGEDTDFVLDITPYSRTRIHDVLPPGTTGILNDDDDFIGLAFGFNSGDQGVIGQANLNSGLTPNYFVFDWKDKYQSQNGVTVFSGMRLQWVTAAPDNTKSGEQHALWRGEVPGVTKVLWSDLSTETTGDESKGYDLNSRYRFFITYTDDRIKIDYEIYADATDLLPSVARANILDLSLTDLQALGYDRAELPDGQLGFYTHSQPNAHFQFVGPQRSVCSVDCGDGFVYDNPTDIDNHETCDLGSQATWTTCNRNTCLATVAIDGATAGSPNVRERVVTGTGDPGSVIRFTITGPTGAVVTIPTESNDIVVQPDGTWTWTTPPLADSGNFTITASNTDRKNGTSTATLTHNVPFPLDTAPDVLALVQGTSSSSLNVLTNDSFLEGVDVTATIEAQGTKGTASITADGVLTYTANADATGTDTVTYRVCVIEPIPELCKDETVTVTIHARPTIAATTIIEREGTTSSSINLHDIYSGDYALDPTNITPTPVNIGGTVSVDTNGVLTFAPDEPDVYGEYEVEFEFCAQSTPAACSTESVTFIWNDNPTVNGGAASVAIGSTTSRPIQASAGDYGTIVSVTATGTGCSIASGELVFVAPATILADPSTFTCSVTVTEDTPTGDPASSTVDWVFTVTDTFTVFDDEVTTHQNTEVLIPIADLTGNDINADPSTFALIGTPDQDGFIATSAGGKVKISDVDPNALLYIPPADQDGVPFIGDDSFEYTVDSSSVAGTSGTGSVTVKVIDFPAVEDTTIWIAVQTPDVTVDIDENYDGDFPLDPTSIREVSTPDGYTVVIGTPGDPTDTTVTIVPNDPSLPATYDVEIEFCDTQGGCQTTTITLVVNDDPILNDASATVGTNTTTTMAVPDLFTDDEQGVVKGGWDPTSLAVSGDPNGPFDASAQGANDVVCAIVNGELQVTSAASVGSATCYVQICEANPGPAGTDTANRACGVKQVTVNVVQEPVTITGPADGSTTTDTTPTVTGTGEPGTEVTIVVDGNEVGKVPVDNDGNWTWTPTTELELGEHTVTARGEDGSEDEITFTIDEEGVTPGPGPGPGPEPEPEPGPGELEDGISITGGRVWGNCAQNGSSMAGIVLSLLAMLAFVTRRRIA